MMLQGKVLEYPQECLSSSILALSYRGLQVGCQIEKECCVMMVGQLCSIATMHW